MLKHMKEKYMKNLKQIFDNVELSSDKWEPYFNVYETYFSKFINSSPVFVEVGVQKGGSLLMWEKYFGGSATIIGIDIDPSVLDHQKQYGENTKVLLGDQGSPEFWDEFLEKYPKIDLFVDDGSHSMHDQKITLEKVFPHISVGGVYICEDTHSSYFTDSGTGCGIQNKDNFIEYCKDLIDILHLNWSGYGRGDINPNKIEMYETLTSIHFYDSMVVLLKDEKKEYKRVFPTNPKN